MAFSRKPPYLIPGLIPDMQYGGHTPLKCIFSMFRIHPPHESIKELPCHYCHRDVQPWLFMKEEETASVSVP